MTEPYCEALASVRLARSRDGTAFPPLNTVINGESAAVVIGPPA
jgi:hypothetical protein